MTRIIITILVVFCLAMPGVYADESLDFVKLPKGSISSVNSILDFTIENRGFEKIFFTLPTGWDLNESVEDDAWSSARGYPVVTDGLWRIYGMPHDRSSYLGAFETTTFLTGKVWTGEGLSQNGYYTSAGLLGWWLWPNEKLVAHLELSIPSSGTTIDPSLLEEDYKWVRVTKWEQEFILAVSLSDSGFFTAPRTVKNAKLSMVYPAAYCADEDEDCPGEVYWDDFSILDEDLDVPDWNEWFGSEYSLAGNLVTTPSPTKTEYMEVDAAEVEIPTVTPVWKVIQSSSSVSELRYTYEWERDKKLTGGVTFGTTTATSTIPAWYQWF